MSKSKMNRFEKKDIKTQTVSDCGMTLELYIDNESNEIEYPLLKVYADEKTEEKYLELLTSKGLIQIPVNSVQSFLKKSQTEVHSESWYEKNVFNENT